MVDPLDSHALLGRIDKKLGVLLALAIADRLPETSRASRRSLDSVLHAAGLTQSEIAALMGKTPQAVSQVLATESARTKPGATKPKSGTRSVAATSLADVTKVGDNG
jgi:hypothetical protein